MTRKSLMLAYAACAYFLALANLVYFIGFLADFGVRKGIRDGEPIAFWSAVLVWHKPGRTSDVLHRNLPA